MRTGTLAKLAGGLALALFVSTGANAALIFDTPSGSTTPDGSVSAAADFAVGNGTVAVTLINNQQNPTADGQMISAITFSVSGATGSGGVTTVNSGMIASLGTDGTYTPSGPDALTRWEASHVTTGVTLTTLSGGKPGDLIIGPDNAGSLTGAGDYSAANASIYGHLPVVLGSATFNITIPGVTAASQISDVVLQFGTTAGQDLVDLAAQPVPEPSTLLAGALLLLPFGMRTLRRAHPGRLA
jgi:hypothetical protein